MRALRTVHYNHTGVVSGAERVLLNVLEDLPGQGIAPVVLSPPGPLQRDAAQMGVATEVCQPLEARFTWKPWRMLRYARSFLRAVRELRQTLVGLRPDVVHANSVRAGLVATAATAGLSIPIVWHVHDTLPRHPFSPVIRAIAALSRRTRLIAVSRATGRTFAGELWRRRLQVKIEVLHNAAVAAGEPASEAATRALRSELGVGDRFTVGCIGQICVRKNQVEMVHIFREVLRYEPEAMLVIAGSALFPGNEPYERKLKETVRELGLDRNVLLLGHRGDVPKLLQAVDLLVLPSRNEPFGMILLEAMRLGTPMVAYAVDGVPELVSDGLTGWLVPPRESLQMARKIVWAARNPAQRARLVAAARLKLADTHTQAQYAARFAAMLRDGVASPEAPQTAPHQRSLKPEETHVARSPAAAGELQESA